MFYLITSFYAVIVSTKKKQSLEKQSLAFGYFKFLSFWANVLSGLKEQKSESIPRKHKQ